MTITTNEIAAIAAAVAQILQSGAIVADVAPAAKAKTRKAKADAPKADAPLTGTQVDNRELAALMRAAGMSVNGQWATVKGFIAAGLSPVEAIKATQAGGTPPAPAPKVTKTRKVKATKAAPAKRELRVIQCSECGEEVATLKANQKRCSECSEAYASLWKSARGITA